MRYGCLQSYHYCKYPKNSDARKHGADGMANSVNPDQIAPLGASCVGAVWPVATMFAQTCLFENLKTLR